MTNPDDQVPTPPPEPARELQARAAQGAVWTVLQTFISLGIGFLVNLVVARYLGVADFGRLATISLAVELSGTIFNLGVGNSLVQMGSKAHAAGRRDEVRGLLVELDSRGGTLADLAVALRYQGTSVGAVIRPCNQESGCPPAAASVVASQKAVRSAAERRTRKSEPWLNPALGARVARSRAAMTTSSETRRCGSYRRTILRRRIASPSSMTPSCRGGRHPAYRSWDD